MYIITYHRTQNERDAIIYGIDLHFPIVSRGLLEMSITYLLFRLKHYSFFGKGAFRKLGNI